MTSSTVTEARGEEGPYPARFEIRNRSRKVLSHPIVKGRISEAGVGRLGVLPETVDGDVEADQADEDVRVGE